MTESAPDASTRQTLYLARHGRTALNAAGRLRGLADPPLDETGLAEAARLGEALAREAARPGRQPIVLVLSSPLQRAVSTASAIAAAVGAPHRADERFNDRDYGPWTGHLKSDVVAEFGSVDAAPGVEPTSTVLARALPALDALRAAGETVVVVTHDAVIRPLLLSLNPTLADLTVPTASWADLTPVDAGWKVESFDNTPT
ncbi:histidine phosphatase family protein [Herbiconiux sp. CPCC 205763]|uniref:Histidine phosphatase family protein n=1 Tax=Herbiconiux aconitum TaxID=2970913 RepID=A0ABT2GR57_9MICO|nr:histidine phosphatase family protein [Herbiconiux aconitum]MCS5718704.1 histidine phosphatase family protein [Herbiconiux aconitum]